MLEECLYSGRAFTLARFYAQPMGLRIKEMRLAKGWTQDELASRSNMSRSQLAMIEAETRPANTLRLNSIAKALGVTPDALFTSGQDKHLMTLIERLSEEDRAALVLIAESLAQKPARD